MRLLANIKRDKDTASLYAIVAVLLLAAIGVYFLIYYEGITAKQNAQELLNQYNQAIETQTQNTPADSKDVKVTLAGYDLIGKLIIKKIGLELPVISQTSEKALKVSICFYSGALPGQKGNTVITGHNYANGAFFGKLDQLKEGDSVELDTPDGKKYDYVVYQTLIVTPDDLQPLNEYAGEYGLTLVTCTNSGNRRLLVRCRIV
jgi:sortase A